MQLIDDRYEVLEVIASGGMATVIQARDTRLGRLVAIKRPHSGPPGGDFAERMADEARAAASLNHPNLVTVHDYGTDADGPYLVMELVDGPTLQASADHLEPDQVLHYGAQLADALAAIHRAGILHRDVKPSNVIMSDRGPLLTDFGIARDPTVTRDRTESGQVMATPAYAAPEVLAGEPATSASDVYSLSVVIAEMAQRAGLTTGAEVDRVLATARADRAEDRPDASTFSAQLRGTLPTAAVDVGIPAATPPSGDDSTLILETAPRSNRPKDDHTRRRFAPWAIALFTMFALVGAAIALDPSDETPSAVPSTQPATTQVRPDTTSPPTTFPTSTATLPGEVDTSEETLGRLETILLTPPRSELNRPEVEELMMKVDEALERAAEGGFDEAGQKLSEVARQIDEKLDDESRDQALSALETVAESIGVEIDFD